MKIRDNYRTLELECKKLNITPPLLKDLYDAEYKKCEDEWKIKISTGKATYEDAYRFFCYTIKDSVNLKKSYYNNLKAAGFEKC